MKLVNRDNIKNWSSTSLSASVNGPWINVEAAEKLSLQITWTGSSLNGTVKLQIANGEADTTGIAPLGTAVDLSGASYAMVSSLIGSDSSLILNFSDVPFTWCRWVWTRTSGTGTLSASRVVMKGN